MPLTATHLHRERKNMAGKRERPKAPKTGSSDDPSGGNANPNPDIVVHQTPPEYAPSYSAEAAMPIAAPRTNSTKSAGISRDHESTSGLWRPCENTSDRT